ncbi:hypothetical protein DFP72DRAFT_1070123 [Ephemerocybe angulata]|uniref:Uncharacterized protein n=1 Tax=Ephemerocybe angulata TaxID=980116 RepID=A0A8H6HUG9_9AGAR|nr:hypothetical protein DFP72DRAFT_1070123 [Tulosesus angulatus]
MAIPPEVLYKDIPELFEIDLRARRQDAFPLRPYPYATARQDLIQRLANGCVDYTNVHATSSIDKQRQHDTDDSPFSTQPSLDAAATAANPPVATPRRLGDGGGERRHSGLRLKLKLKTNLSSNLAARMSTKCRVTRIDPFHDRGGHDQGFAQARAARPAAGAALFPGNDNKSPTCRPCSPWGTAAVGKVKSYDGHPDTRQRDRIAAPCAPMSELQSLAATDAARRRRGRFIWSKDEWFKRNRSCRIP